MAYWETTGKNIGIIPQRRYAIFTDVLRGEHMIVIKGHDLLTAHKWGGFVAWVGDVKCAETRRID